MGDANRPFLSDLTAIRQRARQHIEQGAVTADYSADRQTVLKLLNEALATEIVCTFADRVAIESYREIVKYLSDRDPTSRRLMESVLAAEEEHADDLSSMLVDVEALLGGGPIGRH